MSHRGIEHRQRRVREAWDRIEHADPDISTERLLMMVADETGEDYGDVGAQPGPARREAVAMPTPVPPAEAKSPSTPDTCDQCAAIRYAPTLLRSLRRADQQ